MATLATIFVAHHTMALLHEWTHGTTAWLFGVKDNPFDIHYGDWTLLHVDEDVDYRSLLSTNRGWTAATIAASALVTNAILFVTSLRLLSRTVIQGRKRLFQFVFWFAVMNIAELYSYIPLRAIPPSGDVRNFLYGTGLSVWPVCIAGTVLIGVGIWNVLGRQLLGYHRVIVPTQTSMQYVASILTVLVIFFYFGCAAFFYAGAHDPRSLWSLASFVLGVVALAYCVVSVRRNGRRGLAEASG